MRQRHRQAGLLSHGLHTDTRDKYINPLLSLPGSFSRSAGHLFDKTALTA